MKVADFPRFIDLDNGFRMRTVQHGKSGDLYGWIIEHDRPDGKPVQSHSGRCEGSFSVIPDDQGRAWTVVQVNPLTLNPSLVCTDCGVHGWVRDGKWVPA